MKYKVEMSRTEYGYIEVEAPSEAEACDIATEKEMKHGMTVTNSDCEICRVEEQK